MLNCFQECMQLHLCYMDKKYDKEFGAYGIIFGFAGFKFTINCATEISASILKKFLMEQHN